MNTIKRKIRSSLGSFLRVKPCLPTKAMLTLYNSLLSSHLRQGCAIFFNGGSNTNKHNILRAAPLNILLTIDIASDKNKTAII